MSLVPNTDVFNRYLQNNPGQVDVWSYIDAFLGDANMGDLTTWAQTLLVEYGDSLSPEMFEQRIRETPTYKKRFKANVEREKAGLSPLPESEIIANEKAYQQVARMAGLPPKFYDDPDDFVDFLSKDISPQEYQERVMDGYSAVRNDPRTQQVLNDYYDSGVTEGDLVAFFLDPDRALPVLQRKQAAATIGAESMRADFRKLNRDQAENLANSGITQEQARQGFTNLSEREDLLTASSTEAAGDIDTNTALAAEFEGSGEARKKIESRLQQRTAGFRGGGGYQTDRSGKTGIGSAS